MSIKLNKLKEDDYTELHKITSNRSIMKYVGNGKPWDSKKTKSFLKYSLEEQNSNNKIRTNFFFKISLKKSLIGIIGIHKYETENDYYLTRFLKKSQQGKGYGTKALSLILNKFIKLKKEVKKVISQQLVENIGSQKSCKKVGFVFQKQIKRNGKKYNQYVYYLKLHNILKLEYPYLKYFITKEDIEHSFKKLQKYKPYFKKGTINKFTDKMELIIDFDKERNINQITDYFTDKCRVKCLFKGKKLTPFEYYSKKKGELIHKSFVNKKFNITKFESILFNEKEIKFCNNFQTTIAFTIYKLFKPKNIFDSSAGWGDRLIAALAYGTSYTGVDPSKCLKPLYLKMIKTFTKNKKKKYKIINKGIEDVKVNKGKYDLCFTSPPFFDLEIYEKNKNQSIQKFSSSNKWEKEFLITLINKNIEALQLKGHLVIYFPGNNKFFMNYMMNHTKLLYKGVFSFITPKKRNIFVWTKI